MNADKRHIVFLTPGFAENETDTTSIPALQDYLKLIRKNLPDTKLTVLTFQFPFTNKKYNWHGIDIIPLNGKNNKLNKIIIWFKAWQILKNLNHKTPINVIHSFWIGECSFIGQNFSKFFKIKHIVTAMGQDVFKNKYAGYINTFKSYVVTLSKNQNSLLLKNYDLKSEIIPWSIPLEDFPNLKKNEIDILGVGSLNLVKNYYTFINVIEALVNKYPHLKVAIIGEGKESENIKQEIIKRNLNATITLYGKLQRADVLEKMSSSRILLHTSNYESFGYVFAEALYSGMKIVSFDVGAAKIIPEWKICLSTQEIIETCLANLTTTESSKYRVLLNTQTEILHSYLKLYYE
ncbi:glycosyltransferase [uncultured Flavobacterium sp.]|uniref:glycosyltransferase n=1 Tax=uncultured Flavobacterium sp. TaxID=165435 RepID=UPI0030EDA834